MLTGCIRTRKTSEIFKLHIFDFVLEWKFWKFCKGYYMLNFPVYQLEDSDEPYYFRNSTIGDLVIAASIDDHFTKDYFVIAPSVLAGGMSVWPRFLGNLLEEENSCWKANASGLVDCDGNASIRKAHEDDVCTLSIQEKKCPDKETNACNFEYGKLYCYEIEDIETIRFINVAESIYDGLNFLTGMALAISGCRRFEKNDHRYIIALIRDISTGWNL